jgi:hypothetical protein
MSVCVSIVLSHHLISTQVICVVCVLTVRGFTCAHTRAYTRILLFSLFIPAEINCAHASLAYRF